MVMRIDKEKISLFREKSWEYLRKLTSREKAIIAVCVVSLSVFGLYKVYEPVKASFDRQSTQLANLQTNSETVTYLLNRHLELSTRKHEIEEAYQQIAGRGGILSYIENVIKEKMAIEQSDFEIREQPTRSFAGDFEQAPFLLRFTTQDVPKFVDFLTELVHGERPLIISRLGLRKNRAGDAFEVEIDVSSLRRSG